MTQASTTDLSALMARTILTAMNDGDLDRLEAGLDRAEAFAVNSTPLDTGASEQQELLGAVASQMRRSMDRFSRHLAPGLEGFDVSVLLLHHLAATS